MATETRESTHRWNVEETEAGVRICRGVHEKAAPCEWEEYVLAAEPPVVVPSERERNGVDLIAAERRRQVETEGWTAEHDDEHIDGELCGAAAAYATVAHRQIGSGVSFAGYPPGQTWRWAHDWWKPTENPVRNLVKAGALIAAEIDRLQRSEYAVGSPDRGGNDE